MGLAELTREHIRMPAWMQATFIFCLVAGVIVVWELVEFSSDQLFGTNSQGNDLFDTMLDLLYGAIGGFVMAVLLALHLGGKRRVRLLGGLIEKYVKLNH